MLEIVLPHSSSPMEQDEDDDVIGCLPRLFAPAHKEEIFRMISLIPSLAAPDKTREREGAMERYQKLLDLYQEQPSLLDCTIPILLDRFLSMVKLPEAGQKKKLDEVSSLAMSFLYHLTKVRGKKVMGRQLPHDVSFLAPLISCLEAYSGRAGQHDLGERLVLLLWLTFVVKNPFDLRRFDGALSEGATMGRIMAIAMSYLDGPWDRTHEVASLVVAECLSRPDGHRLLAPLVEDTVACISSLAPSSSPSPRPLPRDVVEKLQGRLLIILALLKKVDRVQLRPHCHIIHNAIIKFFPMHSGETTLVKKMLVKASQRLALVVLTPRLAAWRYTRGRRIIDSSLMISSNGGRSNGTNGTSLIGQKRKGETEREEENEEPLQEPTMMSWVVEQLLRGLEDVDTAVRWSAAKGIGRMVSRLPRDLGSQVVSSILTSKFHRLGGNSSWHGGCLALAELSRRGCLLPSHLPRAFPIIKSALTFEETCGKVGVGSNVRDAACYVLWAWARAYEAKDLAVHVDDVAASLMCVAVLDREVSIRRAASAAFQENVGRQGSFPDGIALLTVADYFAVGNRQRCYSSLAVDVASFPNYTRPLIDHLLLLKVCHWDEVIREQAASCLGLLCRSDPEYLLDKLTSTLLPGFHAKNIVERQGFILASSFVYAGLVPLTTVSTIPSIVSALSAIPSLLARDCTANRPGSEITKHAAAVSMRILSEARLPLQDHEVSSWLSLLEVLASDLADKVMAKAAACAIPFFAHYINPYAERTMEAMTLLRSKMDGPSREGDQTGACLLTQCLLPSSIDRELFSSITRVVESREEKVKEWAGARRAAAKAATTAATNHRWTRDGVRLLLAGTHDYTTDQRGDIGRIVREESMRGLAQLAVGGLLQEGEAEEAVQRMIHLSADKIAHTRMVGCECILALLSSSCPLPSPDLLASVYAHPQTFYSDNVLPSLTPLLQCDSYREPLLRALILSAGGISEGTIRVATQAVIDYLKASDVEASTELMSILAEMVADRMARVSQATLRVLPSLLSTAKCVRHDPDRCPPLTRIVQSLVRIASKTVSPARCRLVLEAFSSLLELPSTSSTWKTAADGCIRALRSPIPAVRRAAADCLSQGLCMAVDVDDEALQTLIDTSWQDTDDAAGIERASRFVQLRVLGGDSI